MANLGVLLYGVLGRGPHPIASSDSEKKLNVSLRLRSPNNVAKGNLMSTSYLVQVVRKSALHVQNLLFFIYLLGSFRLTFSLASPLPFPLLHCSQDLSMFINGLNG